MINSVPRRGVFGLGRMMRGRKVGGKRNTDNVNNFHRDDYIKTMKQL